MVSSCDNFNDMPFYDIEKVKSEKSFYQNSLNFVKAIQISKQLKTLN